jgi:hypothetical protein
MSENKEPFDFMKVRNNNGQPKKDFIPYQDAKVWVNRLGFENYRQWLKFAKLRYKKGPLKGRLIRPKFIPANPQCSYAIRGEWKSDTDFLGTRPIPYLSYEDAKQFALKLELGSSHQWRAWHKETNTCFIPRYPEFVYPEWTIWKDFLGSKYIHYSKQTEPRLSLEETMKFVHSLNLSSPEEYKLWVREHPQLNIPLSPEGVFENWPGWRMFLGKSISDKIEVVQNIDVSVLYIAHYNHDPSNVFEIRLEQGGKLAVNEKRQRTNFKIVKMFFVNSSEISAANQIVTSNCSPWWEDSSKQLVSNIHELTFQLSVLLLIA